MSVVRREGKMVRLKFSGRGLADLDFWTKSDPFLTLSRPNRRKDGLVQIRKTETIMNNLNPDWKLVYVSLSELCDNDFNMMLKIDVWDEDKSSRNDLIGSVQVSLGMLQKLAQSKAALPLVKEAEGIHRRKEGRGNLLVTQCLIEDTPVLPRKASVPGNYPAPSRSHHSVPPPQVNPNQWSQLAMAPMVAAPQTDPYDIPRAPMGAPLAIPEAPLYHQMPSSPFVGTQMPYQPGDQNPYQREVGAYNPAVGLGSNYNGQYVNHHNHHQPSDPADTRPMWVPPSPY